MVSPPTKADEHGLVERARLVRVLKSIRDHPGSSEEQRIRAAVALCILEENPDHSVTKIVRLGYPLPFFGAPSGSG